MSTQPEIPGSRPLTINVPADRRMMLALEMGGQMELVEVASELRALQKQHPSVLGLVMALAVIDRRIAVIQLKTSRTILTVAANAGMPLDGHVIHTRPTDEEITILAIPDKSE